jgi:hypothetical protein
MLRNTEEKVEIWVLEFIERPQVVQAIQKMREEWEEAAEGASLNKVKGSVGYLLDDFARLLGLTPEECAQALGYSLE